MTGYPLKHQIIAIDGPAGAGKGTLGSHLAKHYRMKYLDTGTLYRAVAWQVLQDKGNPEKLADAITAAQNMKFDFRHVGQDRFATFLNDQDVSEKLRLPKVSAGASKVAFFPEVRALLKDFQVNFAQEWAAKIGVILDGRDIGTVICPDAAYKFFLDASPEIRAQRREQDMQVLGIPCNYQEILADILERDTRDRNRTNAPLKPAEDAHVLDTGTMTAKEVLAFVVTTIGKKEQTASQA